MIFGKRVKHQWVSGEPMEIHNSKKWAWKAWSNKNKKIKKDKQWENTVIFDLKKHYFIMGD